MSKYIAAAIPMLLNNEVVSLAVLLVMGMMFIMDMAGWMDERKW